MATAIALAALVTGAALLAACGGSSGGAASPSASAAASAAGSAPFAGSPEKAVVAYWALVDAGDHAGLEAVCVPGSPAALSAFSDGIERARLLQTKLVRRDPGSALVQADVRVVPAGEVTPWGEPGAHTLFISLTKAPGGGWLVASCGTSP